MPINTGFWEATARGEAVGKFDNLSVMDKFRSGLEEESAIYIGGKWIKDKYSANSQEVDETYTEELKLQDLKSSGLSDKYYDYAISMSYNKKSMKDNIKKLKEEQLRNEYKQQAWAGGLGYDLVAGISDFVVPIGALGQIGKYSAKTAMALSKFNTVANINKKRRLLTGLAVDGTIESTKYFLASKDRSELDLALGVVLGAGANVMLGKPSFEAVARVGRERLVTESKRALQHTIENQLGKKVATKEIDNYVSAVINGDKKIINDFVSKYQIDDVVDLAESDFQTKLRRQLYDIEEDIHAFDEVAKRGKYNDLLKAWYQKTRYDMQYMTSNSPSEEIRSLSNAWFNEGTLDWTSKNKVETPLANIRTNMEDGINGSLNLATEKGRLMFGRAMGGSVYKFIEKHTKRMGGVMMSMNSNSDLYDNLLGLYWQRIQNKVKGYKSQSDATGSISKELMEMGMTETESREIASEIVNSLQVKNSWHKDIKIANGDLDTLKNTIYDNPNYTPQVWTNYSSEILMEKGFTRDEIHDYLFQSYIRTLDEKARLLFLRGTENGDKLFRAISEWYDVISKAPEIGRTNSDSFEDAIDNLIKRDESSLFEGNIKMYFNGKVPKELVNSTVDGVKDANVHKRKLMDFDRSYIGEYNGKKIEFADFMERNIKSTHAGMARKYSGRSMLSQTPVILNGKTEYLNTNEKIRDYFLQAKKSINDNKTLSATKKNAELARLEHILKDAMGIPTNVGDMQIHIMSNTLKNFTYFKTLGLSGFKMVSELNAIMWKQGIKRIMKTIPQAKYVFQSLENGDIDDAFVKELVIYGQSHELLQGSTSTKYDHAFDPLRNYGNSKITGFFGDANIGKAHTISEKLRDFTLWSSGMKPLDAGMRISNDIAFVENLIKFGYKARSGTLSKSDRVYLAQAGISDDLLDKFLVEMEKHSTMKSPSTVIEELRGAQKTSLRSEITDDIEAGITNQLNEIINTMLRKEERDLLSGKTSIIDYATSMGLSKNKAVQLKAEVNDLQRKLSTIYSMAKTFDISSLKAEDLVDLANGLDKVQKEELIAGLGKFLGSSNRNNVRVFSDSMQVFLDAHTKKGKLDPLQAMKSINVLMHEIVHSGFDQAYKQKAHFRELLDSLFHDITQGFNGQNRLIDNLGMKSKQVGLQHPVEMLAEIVSNRKFANKANKIKLSKRSKTLLNSFDNELVEGSDMLNQMINTSIAKTTKKGEFLNGISKAIRSTTAQGGKRRINDISQYNGIIELNLKDWSPELQKSFLEKKNRLGNTLLQRSSSAGDETGITFGGDLLQNKPLGKLFYTLKTYGLASHTKQLGRSINEADLKMMATQLSQFIALISSLTLRNIITSGTSGEEFKAKQKNIINESIASMNVNGIFEELIVGGAYTMATGTDFSHGRNQTTTEFMKNQFAVGATMDAILNIPNIALEIYSGDTGSAKKEALNLIPKTVFTEPFINRDDIKKERSKYSKEKAKEKRKKKRAEEKDAQTKVSDFLAESIYGD